MRAIIFDVEHGFCAVLISQNGNVLLIDAGTNSSTGFTPSKFLKDSGYTSIECFVISNYDEDHVSDCPSIIGRGCGFSVNLYHYNESITADQLVTLKNQTGGLGTGLKELIKLRRRARSVDRRPDFDDFRIAIFQNKYPGFADTNNLSLLTFVQSENVTYCFSGDLEKSGWNELLKSKSIQEWLEATSVFIASHHGRQSGYAQEVFSFARPRVVIVSDGPIQYDSQLVNYGQHSSGLTVGSDTRRVLTTRRDGAIYFEDSGIIPAKIGTTKWDRNYFFDQE